MTEERLREFRYRDTRAFWATFGLFWIVLGTVAAFGHNWWIVLSSGLGLVNAGMGVQRARRLPPLPHPR